MKIDAIYRKMQTLKLRRDCLVQEHEIKLAEIDKEIENERQAIERINEAIAPLLCPGCGGKGTERYCDAAGDMDDRPCPHCKGTGVKLEG